MLHLNSASALSVLAWNAEKWFFIDDQIKAIIAPSFFGLAHVIGTCRQTKTIPIDKLHQADTVSAAGDSPTMAGRQHPYEQSYTLTLGYEQCLCV